ncbi:MAG: hypothetical protein NC131_18230 [Roseburia sp.]|nr:hypothetical protein [Roseburia sp.]
MTELFEAYTPTDHQVAKDLGKFDCYLIGGTAIDYWCNKLGVKKTRHRSNNDIDFWTFASNPKLASLHKYLNDEGFSFVDGCYMITATRPGQELDILIDYERNLPKHLFIKQDGLAIMSPIFLFASKFDRYLNTTNAARKKTDEVDLLQLLTIIDRLNLTDKFEHFLANNRHYSSAAENKLNELISKYLESHES